MDITIDELNSTDNPREYLSLLKQLTVLDIEVITTEEYQSRLAVIQSNPYHKIFVAREKTIIGSITVLIEPKFIRNISLVAHIEDVVVNSEFRQYGLGKRLVNHAIEYARSQGCYKVILDCSEQNVGFYTKCGFVVKEKQMALYF
jgi:glucosamine-phosphate N-acetyltransferase